MKIELHNGFYLIKPGDSHVELRDVRSLPSRKFDAKARVWRAPANTENYEALKAKGYDPPGGEPQSTGYRVSTVKNKLKIDVPYSGANVQKCRGIPEKRNWNTKHRAWLCDPTAVNINYLEQVFPTAEWDEKALMFKKQVQSAKELASQLSRRKQNIAEGQVDVIAYDFHTKPFKHQLDAFAMSYDQEVFALLMQQGTGKTKVVIDTAVALWEEGLIDAVLVVCPNGVKSTWVEDEIPTHKPPRAFGTAWEYKAGMNAKQRQALEDWVTAPRHGSLDWLVMNVEGFGASERAVKTAEKFLKGRRCMMVVDESTRIKSPKAKRTKRIVRLGAMAKYRRILTGTPITNSPLDAYSQFHFLDPHILGFGSFYTFRNHYALMGGYGGYQILGYSHLEQLKGDIAPYSYRVLRKDCLDLPPKTYSKVHVQMTPEQAQAYAQMRDYMIAKYGDQAVTAPIVLTQMMRLQQIVGGFIKPDDPDAPTVPIMPLKSNPKIQAMLEVLEEVQGKAIIWARFRPELALISQALREKYGPESVVEFHGGIHEDERTRARQLFQDPESDVKFFVGNPQAGGLGITLTQAETVIYYSNSFSLEDRLQSEDRAHRIGQTKNVLYVDIVADDTIDTKKIVPSLRMKHGFADQVTGDDWREWI